MNSRHEKKGRILAIAAVWIVLMGIGAVAYRLLVRPHLEEELIGETSNPDVEGLVDVRVALDSFSGYAVFRSDEFREEARAQQLAVETVDDGADYGRRFQSLKSGDTPLAVFTIDALIKASADAGELPGTIVLMIDESRGADALVVDPQRVPDVDSLNRPDTQIVVTGDSPSETLVRVVRSSFDLNRLSDQAWVRVGGAEEVFRTFMEDRRAPAGGPPRAYALWEPFVSRALDALGVDKPLIDSSKFQGYIVDVLVVERRFLRDRRDVVDKFVRAYLSARHRTERGAGGLVGLVQRDASALGDSLTDAQAKRLVDGIWWKNTTENFAHFGVGASTQGRLPELGTMVRKITRVLERTGAIGSDPAEGRPNVWYFGGILEQLQKESFHPGMGGSAESIRVTATLRALSDAEWERLAPVGTLQVERIVFARGTSTLTSTSEVALSELRKLLENWPRYYLRVVGHASARGDLEANRRLAKSRADATVQRLRDLGVPAERLRGVSVDPQAGGAGSAVTFVLCELPY